MIYQLVLLDRKHPLLLNDFLHLVALFAASFLVVMPMAARNAKHSSYYQMSAKEENEV